jgi:hypothetical protein
MKAKTLAVVVSTTVLLAMSGAANSAEEEKKCGFAVEWFPGNIKRDCPYEWHGISFTFGQINVPTTVATTVATVVCIKRPANCVTRFKRALAKIER